MPLQLFFIDFYCSLFSKVKCLVTLNLTLGIFFFLSDNLSVLFFILVIFKQVKTHKKLQKCYPKFPWTVNQLSSMIISCINIVQCQNQEINIGTIILTQIEALFRFHQLFHALFFFLPLLGIFELLKSLTGYQ